MPFDSMPEVPEHDVMSGEGFVAWLRTRDEDEAYYFSVATDCLLTRYMRAMGWRPEDAGAFDPDGHYHAYPGLLWVIAKPPHRGWSTVGEALRRAEFCLRNQAPNLYECYTPTAWHEHAADGLIPYAQQWHSKMPTLVPA